jgi:hypothetical protein
LKEQEKSRIIVAEMKFLRKTAQYTLYDHKNVCRMDRSRFLCVITEYRPAGTRNPGRPLKRLLGGYIEAGMGHKA